MLKRNLKMLKRYLKMLKVLNLQGGDVSAKILQTDKLQI